MRGLIDAIRRDEFREKNCVEKDWGQDILADRETSANIFYTLAGTRKTANRTNTSQVLHIRIPRRMGGSGAEVR